MTSLLLTGTEQTIFTASGSQAAPGIILCNNENAANTVTIYVKATAGTSAGDGNCIVNALPIAALESIGLTKFLSGLLLDTGNVITGKVSGTASKVNATISSMAL